MLSIQQIESNITVRYRTIANKLDIIISVLEHIFPSLSRRVNVASLLMIVLMNKMEYATDILKCLLLRLIDKSVLTKHPQLMLRRTESVVEKMLTNYMAICMYDYLKEYAGSSLFLLFKAIKHQIEKGLVDAITHDARYSLSEERLLREQIDHAPVTLHIVQDDLDEKIACKVLDCDSIAQVKSKILDALFRNTPFSLRPAVHEVDLEWRHGRGGHLTLQDEDLTTKTTAAQWRRLNTLRHYGVKESAVMSLIARQNDGGQGGHGGHGGHGGGGGAMGPGGYGQPYGGAPGAVGGKQAAAYHNCYYHLNNSQSHIIMSGDLEQGLQAAAAAAASAAAAAQQVRERERESLTEIQRYEVYCERILVTANKTSIIFMFSKPNNSSNSTCISSPHRLTIRQHDSTIWSSR